MPKIACAWPSIARSLLVGSREKVFMKTKPSSARSGLLAGGCWTVDHIKSIDALPQPGHLANIRACHHGSGGAPYNVLLNLARSGVRFPLYGAGLVGKDAAGEGILADCNGHKIDTKHLGTSAKAGTSFTDVMEEQGSGRRTCFHARGANAFWTGEDLNFFRLKAKHFHLGYLSRLDALDELDAKFGTKAVRLLAAATEAGLKTSVDVASDEGDRLGKIVQPALKFTDYLIINEHEAGLVTGFKVREPNGKLDTVRLRHAAGALLQQGVRELVVLHFPEGAFARTRRGDDGWQSSVKLPPKLIAGTSGAGDAFCAGFLLGVHEGWETQRCLEAGVCVAAACLTEPTCTGGVKALSASLALGKKYRFHPALEAGE